MSVSHVLVAGDALPVLHAAAPGGHVHTVHDVSPLLTEHRLLLPHPRLVITIDLYKGLVVEWVQTAPLVVVGCALPAGDGEGGVDQGQKGQRGQVHGGYTGRLL